jgi:hypothetical protein
MADHITDADVMAAEEHMEELLEEAHTNQMLEEAHVKPEPPQLVIWMRTMLQRLLTFFRGDRRTPA